MVTELHTKCEKVDTVSLLNWCLSNVGVGGRILTDWDVAKNAEEGVYISDISYDYDKEIWMRDMERGSIKVPLSRLVKK